jgi:putative DNA primase/helicase
MVAAPALVGIAAVIGRKVGIRPWLFSDYVVVPNLWGCIVARPASMKSYAIDQAIRPLKRLAATARERFQAGVVADAAHVMALEAEVEGLKSQMKQLAKKGASMGDLEVQLAQKLQELESTRPVERRYWVADSTPEKLADLLRENPTGLLVSYDELAGWLGEMEKQGREGSRAFYLAAWEGTGDHYVDRVQRGSNYIPAVCLSVIGGIQPDRLRRHIDEAMSGGSGGDGMLQRFQMMIFIDHLGEWKAPDAWPASSAREMAYQVFQALDEMDLSFLGTHDDDEIPYMRFAPDAQVIADQWRDELEQRLRGDALKEAPAFEAHLGKYRSLMPNLALIFHLLDTSLQFVKFVKPISQVFEKKFSKFHLRLSNWPLTGVSI